MVITDSGPDAHRQPSKLWTPRSEFQEIREAHNPVSFNPISMTEAFQSVNAIAAESLKKPVCKERSENLLAAVGKKVQAATKTLDVGTYFDMDNTEHAVEMWGKVDEAALVAISAAKSIARLPDSSDKTNVISALKALEIRIDFIGASLPPDTTPFVYDAGELLLGNSSSFD